MVSDFSDAARNIMEPPPTTSTSQSTSSLWNRKLKASREGPESEHVPVGISGLGFRLEGLGFGVWRSNLRVRSRGVVMRGTGLEVKEGSPTPLYRWLTGSSL